MFSKFGIAHRHLIDRIDSCLRYLAVGQIMLASSPIFTNRLFDLSKFKHFTIHMLFKTEGLQRSRCLPRMVQYRGLLSVPYSPEPLIVSAR